MSTITSMATLKLEDTDYPLLTPTQINQQYIDKDGNQITFTRITQLKTALDALQPNPPNTTTVWFDNTLLLDSASTPNINKTTISNTSFLIDNVSTNARTTIQPNSVVLRNILNNTSTISVDNTTSDLTMNCSTGSVSIVPQLNTSSQIRSKNHIHTDSTTYNQRQMYSSYFNMYDGANGQTNLVEVGRMFCLGTTGYLQVAGTAVDNTTLNLQTKRGGSTITHLTLADNATFNRNIIQGTANTIISQDGIIADLSSNIFKRSEIKTNFAGASNTSALDVYESVSGRGFRFVSDASGNSSYNDLTISRDNVLVSRFRPTSSTLGLVVGLNDAGGTGIRFSSATATKGRVQIQAGTTNAINVYDDSDATYPNTTTYNRAIRMVGTDANSRNIVDAGVLSMKDLAGGSASAGIYVTAGGNQVIYVANNSGYKHSFYVTDPSGNPQERFNIANTEITRSVPVVNTYSGSYTSNQIGYTINQTYSASGAGFPTSSTTLGNFIAFGLGGAGLYLINTTVRFFNTNVSTNFNINEFYFGFSDASGNSPIAIVNTGYLASGQIKPTNAALACQTIGLPKDQLCFGSSCTYLATTASKSLYYNGYISWSSGTPNSTITIVAIKIN